MISKKFKKIILAISAAMAVAMLAPVVAFAGSDIQGSVCYGSDDLQVSSTATTDCQAFQEDDSNFNDLLTKVINILSTIVGVIAVIMIIIGGFRYVTSGGESTKVAGAKNTILYGLVGLVIVALAQVVVRFVLKSVTE